MNHEVRDAGEPGGFRPLDAAQLRNLIHKQTGALLVGELEPAGEIALYTLSDPRDVAGIRYVGQTRSPHSRFTQHLNQARLWLPDEVPWWIATPRLRPLYAWIRELHRDGYRLPVMNVTGWSENLAAARLAERWLIRDALKAGRPLLNVEREVRERRVRRVNAAARKPST